MMKIGMVEYQGRCDENGVAVGHSPKVLAQYYKIVSAFANVNVYAPKTILRSLDTKISKGAKVLPYHILMEGKTPFIKKITNKLNMFKNIKLALKNSDDDVVWFFNVEYYIMLYLAFFVKTKKKIVCTLFINGYEGGKVAGIKQKIFEKAQKKMSIIIASGKNFKYKNCRSVYIPDYIFEGDEQTAGNATGREGAVCLGTMGKDKQLSQLVNAFTANGQKLTIAGRFYDKKWPVELQKNAGPNITIIDDYIDKDEYDRLLFTAQYCVLPYDPDKYGIQTSGVLQEACFHGTIPVSFNRVLQASDVPGISFDSWEQIADGIDDSRNEDIRQELKELRETVYDRDIITRKYESTFNDVIRK